MLLRKYVLGMLIVACFVGGGYLASGVHTSAPVTTTVDQTKVWNDLQRRADELRRTLPPAAPTPAPTPHDNTERSI
jgi:hypothetical protein